MTDQGRPGEPEPLFADDDCVAGPLPALLDSHAAQDRQAVERFWAPISIAVLASWTGVSFLLFAAFGWWAVIGVAGISAGAIAVALLVFRTGSRGDVLPVVMLDAYRDTREAQDAADVTERRAA